MVSVCFFKQKTAYEMLIGDWSADVCSSDLTPLGEIAILYSVAWLGDELATAAENAGFGVIRSDNRALYPRSSPILRWLEQCAIWCCDGWRAGQPRMGKLVSEGARLFRETVADEEERKRVV